MKKHEIEVRKKMIVVRMNKTEFGQLEKFKKESTERSMSNYLRKVSLKKPVTVKYRNQSADDFLKEILVFKKELNGIGNNFNQVVKKLHLLDKIGYPDQNQQGHYYQQSRLYSNIPPEERMRS